MNSSTSELEPYLLCDPKDGRCATWRVEANGEDALAFFTSGDNAKGYRTLAKLSSDWKVIQPDRRQLALLLSSALEIGVTHAVLDPSQQGAKRIFQLAAMRTEIEQTLN